MFPIYLMSPPAVTTEKYSLLIKLNCFTYVCILIQKSEKSAMNLNDAYESHDQFDNI